MGYYGSIEEGQGRFYLGVNFELSLEERVSISQKQKGKEVLFQVEERLLFKRI